VVEEKCDDAMSPEPLGELLVTDMDEYHSDIRVAALDVVGDVAGTPSTGAGGDKLCCSYKKCNRKEQMPCSVQSCKIIHPTCFHHYLRQSSFDFEVKEDVFCCATKACCSKFRVGNQGPTTRWDLDGPNRPNTVPNSKTILIDW
jgi:hypothetical protein